MSIVKRTVLAAGSLLTVAAMQLPAHADTLYNWSVSGGNVPLTIAGTLEAESNGVIDSITVNGATSASLYTGAGFEGIWTQDNTIYPASSDPSSGYNLLSEGNGIAFTYTVGSSSQTVNIFYEGGDVGNDFGEQTLATGAFGTGGFTLTATPLPASWSMILSGLAFVAFFAYRRSSKTGNTFA